MCEQREQTCARHACTANEISPEITGVYKQVIGDRAQMRLIGPRPTAGRLLLLCSQLDDLVRPRMCVQSWVGGACVRAVRRLSKSNL